ncbi:MAG: hypothetical protein ABIN91_00060 [Mucilaginibacter sp.]|uniref:hypothetical protein n=1 Tax=Mucilaginibacter sp. TaxID=1882438 RepID=UPI00326357B7
MDAAAEIDKIKSDFLAWDHALNGVSNLPLEEAYLLMKKSLKYFPNMIFEQPEYPMTIYRARIISKDSQEDISNPKTFSYPPKEFVKSYQRASVPGFPVFYGAMDAKTAMEELKTNSLAPIKKGDQFYLSEWRVKNGGPLIYNCLTFSEIVGDQYLIGQMTERVNFAIKTILAKAGPEFQEVQTFVYNQLSQLFLTGNYLQSGPIAYKILYDCQPEERPNAILYPSCSNNYESINCAFHPDFVDQNMTMEIVRKLSFEEFTELEAHSLAHFFGSIEKGKIAWKNRITQMHGKYTMTLDMSSEWPDEFIEKVPFYVRNEEIDLTKFCENLIDEIEFEKITIPQKFEDPAQPDKPLELVFTYPLEDENCYFEDAGQINIVKSLTLTIPANSVINSVKAEQVIKS